MLIVLYITKYGREVEPLSFGTRDKTKGVQANKNVIQ